MLGVGFRAGATSSICMKVKREKNLFAFQKDEFIFKTSALEKDMIPFFPLFQAMD